MLKIGYKIKLSRSCFYNLPSTSHAPFLFSILENKIRLPHNLSSYYNHTFCSKTPMTYINSNVLTTKDNHVAPFWISYCRTYFNVLKYPLYLASAMGTEVLREEIKLTFHELKLNPHIQEKVLTNNYALQCYQ